MNEHWNTYPVLRGLDAIQDYLPIIYGHGFVAGSYAAFMASTAGGLITPSDVDIFAVSDEAARRIATQIGQARNLPPYVEGPAVIGWSVPQFLPIQIIKPARNWSVFPDDIMASFDLSVSRAVVFQGQAGVSVLADEGIHTPEAGKILVINDPVRTLRRVAKYMARGMQLNDWELLKVFDAWVSLGSERRNEKMASAHALAFPEPPLDEPEVGPEVGPDYSFRDDEDDYQAD